MLKQSNMVQDSTFELAGICSIKPVAAVKDSSFLSCDSRQCTPSLHQIRQAVQAENRPSIEECTEMELNTCCNSDGLAFEDRDVNILNFGDQSSEMEDSFYEIDSNGHQHRLFDFTQNLSGSSNQTKMERKHYRAWIGAKGLHLA